MLRNSSEVDSKGLYLSSEKEKEFHVLVMQQQQRNVPNAGARF